jgi:hypothetical protein
LSNQYQKRVEKQQRKDREFHQRVRVLVYVELIQIGVMFNNLHKRNALDDDASKSAIWTMMNLERQYPKLPLEIKASSFDPKVLQDMGYAYQFFNITTELFKVAFPKFEHGEISLENLKQRLNLKNAIELIEKTEKELTAEYEQLRNIDTEAIRERVDAT